MMMTIPELGTPGRRAAMKSKGTAEFSAGYLLASPQNIINWEITVHFPRRWVLPLVLFNRTISFLIEEVTTQWLGYLEVYLQPFYQLIKSAGWKTNGCVFFSFSIPALPSQPSELGFLWWCGFSWLLLWMSETGLPCLAPKSICVGFANFILVLGV